MADLNDGESVEVKGSGARPYVLKNTGGVYSCTCPAWRNQSVAIERRTCKHLRKLRGDAAEEARLGEDLPERAVKTGADGETLAPPLLLAESWDSAADLTGWWMSEKLDGVRAYWDGSQFISRLGNRFFAPDWFVEGLPSEPLDGELWIDRKRFQRTVSIVRRQDGPDLWQEVRYVVFDAPACSEPFERRLELVAECLAEQRAPFARPHQQALCSGLDHLREELARVEGLGGEGLMLREPESIYVAGRSTTLLKVKNFLDAEAVVLAHQAGAGRHKGRLGALLVQLADGTRFAVGTGFSDAQRESPPPVGSTIAFRYQELSEAGVPRFPSYVGVRVDAPVPPAPAAEEPVLLQRLTLSVPDTSAPAAETAPPGAIRHFEFADGNSAKFWEVSVTGTEVTVRYGRIGSAGQSRVKSYASEDAAIQAAEKLVGEKTREGYLEAEA